MRFECGEHPTFDQGMVRERIHPIVTGDGVPLEESPETHGMLLQSHQLQC